MVALIQEYCVLRKVSSSPISNFVCLWYVNYLLIKICAKLTFISKKEKFIISSDKMRS